MIVIYAKMRKRAANLAGFRQSANHTNMILLFAFLQIIVLRYVVSFLYVIPTRAVKKRASISIVSFFLPSFRTIFTARISAVVGTFT